MTTAIVDSSFFIGISDPQDSHHEQAVGFAKRAKERLLVPQIVLPEVYHVLSRHVSYQSALLFLRKLSDPRVELIALVADDVVRAVQIMAQYRSSEFDFVDAAIMALAERLHVRTALTFDHRDFRLFRPAHCEFLDLLP